MLYKIKNFIISKSEEVFRTNRKRVTDKFEATFKFIKNEKINSAISYDGFKRFY